MTRPTEAARDLEVTREAMAELYAALKAVSDMFFARPDMLKALRPLMGPAEHAVCDAAAAALAKARGERG